MNDPKIDIAEEYDVGDSDDFPCLEDMVDHCGDS